MDYFSQAGNETIQDLKKKSNTYLFQATVFIVSIQILNLKL